MKEDYFLLEYGIILPPLPPIWPGTWYSHYMVAQTTMSMCTDKQLLIRILQIWRDCCRCKHKCRKQTDFLNIYFLACVLSSELPSNISTMNTGQGGCQGEFWAAVRLATAHTSQISRLRKKTWMENDNTNTQRRSRLNPKKWTFRIWIIYIRYWRYI